MLTMYNNQTLKYSCFLAGIKTTNIDEKSIEKEVKNTNMLVTNEKNEKKLVNKSKYPRNERVRVSLMDFKPREIHIMF